MKAVVLLSGGLDSAVLLAKMVHYGDDVSAITVNYGQKHRGKEIACARDQAERLGVHWSYLNLTDVYLNVTNPLLTRDKSIPEGSYAEQLKDMGGRGVVETYVPNRNMVLLSIAGSRAFATGATAVAYAAHMDDAIGSAYPDCTPEFVEAMDSVLKTQGLSLFAPFINKTKGDIVRKGFELGVPFEYTWSCYEGSYTPCGKCGTCLDRAAAFAANGKADPLLEA